MKKIKMLTSIASADFSYGFNQVVTVEKELADKWIKSGIAAEVKEEETATKKTPETAAKRRKK
jgi:hypothetical protein